MTQSGSINNTSLKETHVSRGVTPDLSCVGLKTQSFELCYSKSNNPHVTIFRRSSQTTLHISMRGLPNAQCVTEGIMWPQCDSDTRVSHTFFFFFFFFLLGKMLISVSSKAASTETAQLSDGFTMATHPLSGSATICRSLLPWQRYQNHSPNDASTSTASFCFILTATKLWLRKWN